MNTLDSLNAALTDARQNYIDKRPASLAAFHNATRFMPGGNTRTVLFYEPFPLRAARGEGAQLIDVDGHSYVNLLGEYTAGLFGHTHPVIRAALDRALDDGINLGAHNVYESQLAELVCARFPCMERVRFTNSGTEANLMAISSARVHTGRNKVLVFDGGYHGALLYFAHGGVPINAPFPYLLGEYNACEATRELIRSNANTLACVLVEPMMGAGGCIPGDAKFLSMLREETARAGAVLIFDEVMTSRLAPGGAQQLLGITPDMTTLGKYVGGGMSFGAFGGSQSIMNLYDPRNPEALPHAGTFNNNTLTMAAGCAALRDIYTPEAAERLNTRGDQLRENLNEIARSRGLPVQFSGQGSLMNLHTVPGRIHSPADLRDENEALKELLFLDLLDAGYYMARRGFIGLSLAVDDACLRAFADAYADLLDARGALIAGVGNVREGRGVSTVNR
jgi:glutamate-1-semialdehyde 2,1-aminomutase